MRPDNRVPRRRGLAWPWMAAAVAGAFLVGTAGLWVAGLLDLSRFRAVARSTAGLVPVPIAAQPIPAYTRITRDHFWNPQTQQLAVVYLPPASVTPVMLTQLGAILGRVLDHDKAAGFIFTEDDFLPKGTREGLVGGIPAGKRALRVEADRVEGLFGLRPGDRFDLVATLPIDPRGAQGAFNVGGTFGNQMAMQAQLSNWQKQATVRVMVQNGVVVAPMTTRQVPVFSRTLTQGGITRMRPVQEAVIAVDPDEVARLTEAMAVDAKISVVPRSGRPDDPLDSVTPDLRPVSPFGGGGVGVLPDQTALPVAADGFTMVEQIAGSDRQLTTVPRR